MVIWYVKRMSAQTWIHVHEEHDGDLEHRPDILSLNPCAATLSFAANGTRRCLPTPSKAVSETQSPQISDHRAG